MTNIKRLTKYVALSGNNDEKINEYKSYEQQFDVHQNCIKEIEFTKLGEIDNASAYTFNDKHKMIEEIHYFNHDEIGEHIKYIVDEEGKRLEIETIYADNAKSVKKINRSDQLVTAKSFDEEGEFEGEESVKFDNKGRPVEEVQLDEERNILQRSVFEYNESNNVHSRINYGEHDEFQMKSLFEYDDHNNLVKLMQLNQKDELIASYVYEYDKQGNQTLQQSNHHLIHTEYDDQGRIIIEETKNRSNNMVEKLIEYKYGEHGHVIEERMFSMGDAYQLEPGVFSRTASSFLVTRYEYEFYEN